MGKISAKAIKSNHSGEFASREINPLYAYGTLNTVAGHFVNKFSRINRYVHNYQLYVCSS